MANAAGYSRLNRKTPAERAAINGNTLRPIGKTPVKIQTKAQAIGTAQMQGRSQAAQLQHQQDRVDSGMQFNPGLAQPAPFQPRAVSPAPLAPAAVPIRPASAPPATAPLLAIPDSAPGRVGSPMQPLTTTPSPMAGTETFPPPGMKTATMPHAPVVPPPPPSEYTGKYPRGYVEGPARPYANSSQPMADAAYAEATSPAARAAYRYGIQDQGMVGPNTLNFYNEEQAREQRLADSQAQVDQIGTGAGRWRTLADNSSTFIPAPVEGLPEANRMRPMTLRDGSQSRTVNTEFVPNGTTRPTNIVGGTERTKWSPSEQDRPAWEAAMREAAANAKRDSIARYGGESQRQAAMDAAVAKRQAYLAGGGKTVKDIREGRMAQVQTVARGQAEGRRARLEQRKWNQVPRPMTAEEQMMNRDPRIALAMMGQRQDAFNANADRAQRGLLGASEIAKNDAETSAMKTALADRNTPIGKLKEEAGLYLPGTPESLRANANLARALEDARKTEAAGRPGNVPPVGAATAVGGFSDRDVEDYVSPVNAPLLAKYGLPANQSELTSDSVTSGIVSAYTPAKEGAAVKAAPTDEDIDKLAGYVNNTAPLTNPGTNDVWGSAQWGIDQELRTIGNTTTPDADKAVARKRMAALAKWQGTRGWSNSTPPTVDGYQWKRQPGPSGNDAGSSYAWVKV